MRVSINGHYLYRKMSGLARYARQIQGVLEADGHQLVQIQPPNWFYREGGKLRRVLRFIVLAGYELLLPPLTLLLGRADCHISPAFAAPLGLFSTRYLVVVHDLAFVEYPAMYTRLERVYMRMNLGLLRWGRHRIVAPSEFVKDQICLHYRISPSRVHTISPYSDFAPRDPLFNKEEKYFILLSNAHPRKNLQATVSGFLSSKACSTGYRMIVVGNFEKVVHADARQVLVYKGVSDEQLKTLISGATALVLFSLSEGFGFPVVEAASLGVVSLTSGVSSLAELSIPGEPVHAATHQDEIKATFDRFLTDAVFRDKAELNRQYVNATFSRRAFDQRWRELIRGE
jgi:glycosyltransferase involved in cell wall biosynthesis